MTGFSEFMTYALGAVFVQNVVFNSTSDTGLTLLALRKPPKLIAVSLLVSFFSLLSILTVFPLDRIIGADWLNYMPVRGALLSASALLWYLIAGGIIRRIDSLNSRTGAFLAPSALNGAVMAMPLLMGYEGVPSVWAAIGMAVGAGFGFALASWLINIGMRRMNNPDIPKHLQGAPAMLIYIGLLSLLFSAFGA